MATKGPEVATLRGEECVRENEVRALPVDPVAVAKNAEIDVYEKTSKPGVSGMLIRVGERFAIAYATHIPSTGFQNFSIGHELGHYFLAGHVDHVLDGDGVHESRASFASDNRYEREADLFAVGLLMPRRLFLPAMRTAGEGLGCVEQMAERCRTSLVATAMRVAELSNDALAVVVTNQTEIEIAALSKSFRELKIDWPKRGDPIPRRTLTSRFNGDLGRIARAEKEDTETDLTSWFVAHGRNASLLEEVVGLGRYGKTLTVLSVQDEPDDDGDDEDEESLEDSWTPSFGGSRRR